MRDKTKTSFDAMPTYGTPIEVTKEGRLGVVMDHPCEDGKVTYLCLNDWRVRRAELRDLTPVDTVDLRSWGYHWDMVRIVGGRRAMIKDEAYDPRLRGDQVKTRPE